MIDGRVGVLLLCAGCLLACQPDTPAPSSVASPSTQDAPPAPAGGVSPEAAVDVPVSPAPAAVPLDMSVPQPSHQEVGPLDIPPKTDLGNVFAPDEKGRRVNVSGEVLLREDVGSEGQAKTVIDGAQVTVQKPVR